MNEDRSTWQRRVEEIIAFIEAATEDGNDKWKGNLPLFTLMCESPSVNEDRVHYEWLASKFDRF